MITKIKMLDFQDWKIMKEILIISRNSHEQEIVIGVISYLRKIGKNYYLQDDTEKDELLKCLNYPKQELFPQDVIDEIILSAVRLLFPKSFVRNSTISFDSDLERIKIITQIPKQNAKLEIRPDFSQVNSSKLIGQEFNLFIKDINIYQHFTTDSIKGKYFIGICDFHSQEDIYQKLDEIEFL